MAVRFYYASGSPYAWRVWLALERKGIPYHRKTLSFSDGDLKTQEYGALNPRRRVPVLVDDDFVLAEFCGHRRVYRGPMAKRPGAFRS